MPRRTSVVEGDGKPGRMPPRMGAWQPERLRYGAATKNQRVAGRFPERKANATRSWMNGAGIGSLEGVRRKQRTRRISQFPPTAPQFAQAPCPTGGGIPLCISRWCARCPSLFCHTCFSLQHASPQFPFEQIRDRGHVGLAARGLHRLAHQEVDHRCLAALVLFHLFGIGGDHVGDDLLQRSRIGNLF